MKGYRREARQSLADAMRAIEGLPGVKLVCREGWNDVRRAVKWAAESEEDSIADAAQKLRDRTRIFGRRPDRYTVSRTLLAKGLEFDGAAVLAADKLDAQNLYVALTRGRGQIVVMSSSPRINPVAGG